MYSKSSIIFIGIILSELCLVISCGWSDIDYFPLNKGKYWRYAMTYQTMDGHFKGVYAVENLGQEKINGENVYIRQLLDGSYDYIQVNEKGIFLKGSEKTVDFKTENKEADRYIIQYPLQVGNKWNETVVSKALIKTGPPQKTEFHIVAKIPVDVTIESMTDTVKVPAGTFTNCMRITLKGSDFVNAGNYVGMTVVRLNETNWYAPDVGLVKSIREESTKHRALDKGEIIIELEEYRS